MKKLTVIIPFYQKVSGLLNKAVKSVIAQKNLEKLAIEIVVVDDGSPCSAYQEVGDIIAPSNIRLKIITQTNSGVAAARNKGLASIDPNTSYIAFLDADDYWDVGHLTRALNVLSQNCDFYFCDSRREGSYPSYFELIKFRPSSNSEIKKLDQDIFKIEGSKLISQCVRTNVALTSTIVFATKLRGQLEFDASLYPAGEDNLFYLQLISRATFVGFSTHTGATYTSGVGLWHSRYSWDAPTHALSQVCRVVSTMEILRRVPMLPSDKNILAAQIIILQRFVAYLSIRAFFKRIPFWTSSLLRLIRAHREFWKWYCASLIYVFVMLTLRQYKPPNE